MPHRGLVSRAAGGGGRPGRGACQVENAVGSMPHPSAIWMRSYYVTSGVRENSYGVQRAQCPGRPPRGVGRVRTPARGLRPGSCRLVRDEPTWARARAPALVARAVRPAPPWPRPPATDRPGVPPGAPVPPGTEAESSRPVITKFVSGTDRVDSSLPPQNELVYLQNATKGYDEPKQKSVSKRSSRIGWRACMKTITYRSDTTIRRGVQFVGT